MKYIKNSRKETEDDEKTIYEESDSAKDCKYILSDNQHLTNSDSDGRF
eukprot:CAMPEP_0170555178 /NCGR_PEP_ID=MMETSP0211-20121228/13066_1 /TAXON_ID=311385 /ORGANISM="Pseudokeronopsis sp., Strain OXSARD2" /LENGTH=47 /DNA_ID= /DNA_START= /DNA_END= /DNA_ORIENTATION=